MIRGIVQTVIEGAIKRSTASGHAGERIADREYFLHYGFTSRPPGRGFFRPSARTQKFSSITFFRLRISFA
ncbi:MAG: phage baseplate assembly protein [Deltaproteobacteria bacterium]|nr:phage baseplate assembly protein [Deltaproteobacteria bacterium]